MFRMYILWAAVIAGLYTWGTIPTHYKTDVTRMFKGDREGWSSHSKGVQTFVGRWEQLPTSNHVEDRRGD